MKLYRLIRTLYFKNVKSYRDEDKVSNCSLAMACRNRLIIADGRILYAELCPIQP